jgi:hypothetical protein
MNQKAITAIGTMNKSRLQVYPCRVGSSGITRVADRRIVFNAIAAGTATMATMATTIQALRRGDGELAGTVLDMKALLSVRVARTSRLLRSVRT